MTGAYFAAFLLDAAHIILLMGFCRGCMGARRAGRRAVILIFAAFWLACCALRLLPASGRPCAANSLLLLAEAPFLLGVSFLYGGSLAVRLAAAVFLPALYWGGQWVAAMAVYGRPPGDLESAPGLVITAAALALLFALELVLERAEKSRRERERELLERELRMYENQFDIIRQSQQNARALRHDLRHHVNMLSDMISSGDSAAALDYLASMGAFMENPEAYVDSGNERADGILNYMIARARAEGIDVGWKIQIPERLDMDAFDINVILSNLLDNSLNALRGAESPTLRVLMRYDRGVLRIGVRNNGADPAHVPGEPGGLLEELSREHGYGLKNVRRIAEKYHGAVTTRCEAGVFDASVLLYLNS